MNLLQDETFASQADDSRLTLIEPVSKKRPPIPCGLDSRRQEYDELGEKAPISECFACIYAGEERSGYIQSEEIQKMLNMIRVSITKISPTVLCKYIARKYLEIQYEVNRNLLDGQEPLPDWPAASVLDHLRNHVNDPALEYWFRACELNELTQIALHASVVIDPSTGNKSIDVHQGKMYMEFIKLKEALAKSDLTKKNYYSDGAYVDTSSASTGPIATSGKKLIAYMRDKNKKTRLH
jgi:hypothetical protein